MLSDKNKRKMRILAKILVLIGALNWGLTAFNFNIVEKLDDMIGKFTKKRKIFSTFIYIVIALSALYLVFDKETYLPFLGEAAFPCDSLKEFTPENATREILVKTTPNRKVVYWAAEPLDEGESTDRSYKDAYKTNNGVVTSDKNGMAKLLIREPAGYTVPRGKTLKSHVHYRTCESSSMLGEVITTDV